ncbi:MAG: hypothetical protein AABZ53_13025 [Planctomycetota bacterium]
MSEGAPSTDSPGVPRWAMALSAGTTLSRRVKLQLAHQADEAGENGRACIDCAVVIRTGRDAALVSVEIDGDCDWTSRSLESAVEQMIALSLDGLGETAFDQPARLWNFLPGIGEPIGQGLDRYRVFNIARHRVFEAWFGAAALQAGRIPTASCVGHAGLALSTHALGTRGASVPVENPRQIPAFAYSTKFGPRPPCFSRAGLVEVEGKRFLFVAGTSSVCGEESVHDGSLESQLRETVLNLRAVVAQGRRGGYGAKEADVAPELKGVLATRIYHRRPQDRQAIARALPSELVQEADVEFVLADICRPELLVEIEIMVDAARA